MRPYDRWASRFAPARRERPAPESLRITFTITSGGAARYQAVWRSEWYFIYERPIDSIPEAERTKHVNDHLHEFFQPQAFGRLNPADSW